MVRTRHFSIRLVQQWTNGQGKLHNDPRIHIVPVSNEAAEAIKHWRSSKPGDAPLCVKEFGTVSQIHIHGLGLTYGYRFRPLAEQPEGFLAYIAGALDEMNQFLSQSSQNGAKKSPAASK